MSRTVSAILDGKVVATEDLAGREVGDVAAAMDRMAKALRRRYGRGARITFQTGPMPLITPVPARAVEAGAPRREADSPQGRRSS